jgi:protein-S-isoprenylcysteine O-methyltransferase Ste14
MSYLDSIWQLPCAFLLLACLASFAWGMKSFFVQPAGATRGMRITKFSGLVCSVLHFSLILTSRMDSGKAQLATALYLLSLGLFWWAIHANRARPLSAVFSPDLPIHLVKRGPYRWVRHPLYTSYLLTWCAGVVATGRPWLIATVMVMTVIYWRAARQEEAKFLRSALASVYASYRSQTGLFAPSVMALVMHVRSALSA